MAEERRYPVTEDGLKQWHEEYDQLINVKRPALAKKLRAAILQGDLSENADYKDAKEKQGFLEGRILELKEMIGGAQIFKEGTGSEGEVVLGSQVTVVDEDGIEASYLIVGPAEASPRDGRISHKSPLGEALLGGKPGEKVTFSAPAGDIVYKITSVE